jgi:hypothetical protein
VLSPRTERDYRQVVERWTRDGQPDPVTWVAERSSEATRRSARAGLIWHFRVNLGRTLDPPDASTGPQRVLAGVRTLLVDAREEEPDSAEHYHHPESYRSQNETLPPGAGGALLHLVLGGAGRCGARMSAMGRG